MTYYRRHFVKTNCIFQEAVEGDDDGPVVVVSLGRGGGKAWGVPPDAAVGGVDGRPTWNAFREEVRTPRELFKRKRCRIFLPKNGSLARFANNSRTFPESSEKLKEWRQICRNGGTA